LNFGGEKFQIRRHEMMPTGRFVFLQVLAISALALLFGCSGGSGSGSGSNTPSSPTATAVAGKWEFVAISTANPTAFYPGTLIETNLSQTDTSISAGTNATAVAGFDVINSVDWNVSEIIGVNNNPNVCGGAGAAIDATISGNTLTFTLSETGPDGTYAVTGTVTVNSNGQSMTGTYTAAAACGQPNDTGNVTGTLVGSLSGNYKATFADGTVLAISVAEDQSHNLTVTGTSQGQAFTLTGKAIGGGVIVSGDIPSIGQDSFVGFEMTSQLVSMAPTVNGLATKQGDFLLFDSDGNPVLVQPN
jgi:hypothetical protein